MKPIRKAVFPVAGLGTRFLPATKAMPKEMLTVVDRPLIQHVVDEAREAGIEHFIFVTGRNKGVIEDHFDRQFELEMTLRERGKKAELDAARARPAGRRHDELHPPAVAARPRPRGVVRARTGRQRAVRAAAARRAGAAQARLPRADDRRRQRRSTPTPTSSRSRKCRRSASHMYGVVGVGKPQGQGVRDHQHGGEAASAAEAPSNLIITGRYILQPEIFDMLEKQAARRGRRNPAHRRDDGAGAHAAVLRPQVRRPQLRLRLEDRLPRRQRRLRAGAGGHRAGVPRRDCSGLLGEQVALSTASAGRAGTCRVVVDAG